jgi:hypothetical protein
MPTELVTTQGDEILGNTSGSLVSAASLTTTQTTADQVNTSARGVQVTLDWLSGSGSNLIRIQGKDPTSGKYFTLLEGGSISSASTTTYTLYPGLTAVANSVVSGVLPRTWRVVALANNASPASYTVGYNLIV